MSESKNVADLFAELWCALQADAAELQNQNWYEAQDSPHFAVLSASGAVS
jgi:hypothetical protein